MASSYQESEVRKPLCPIEHLKNKQNRIPICTATIRYYNRYPYFQNLTVSPQIDTSRMPAIECVNIYTPDYTSRRPHQLYRICLEYHTLYNDIIRTPAGIWIYIYIIHMIGHNHIKSMTYWIQYTGCLSAWPSLPRLLVLLSSTDRSSPAAWPTGGAVVKNGRGAVGECPGCGRMSGIMHVLPLKTPSFAI